MRNVSCPPAGAIVSSFRIKRGRPQPAWKLAGNNPEDAKGA
jgi:hypothetical protein